MDGCGQRLESKFENGKSVHCIYQSIPSAPSEGLRGSELIT